MSPGLDGNLGQPGLGSTSGGIIEDLAPSGSGSSSGIVDTRWLLGVRIDFRTESMKLADDYVRTSTGIYEGLILKYGHIERSISVPVGPPHIGDCLVRVADADQRLRKLLAVQTGRRRLMEILRITDGAILGGFEITDIQYGDLYVEFRGTDIISKWLDRPIDMLGTRAIFPYMAEGTDEFFFPIPYGLNFSPVANPQGMFRVPHIGQTNTAWESPSRAVDRYALSRWKLFSDLGIPVSKSCDIYRKLPGEARFTIVPRAEYVITNGNENLFVNGVYYIPAYLDFLAVQDEGAEIRADCYGIDFIPNVAGGSYLQNSGTDTDPLRNPMDLLFFMLFFVVESVGGDLRPARYNADSFTALRTYYQYNNINADGVITESISMNTFLSWLQTSVEFEFFVNRHYQFEVAITDGSDSGRPVLSDNLDFVTITPQMAQLPVNRIVYRYGYVPATGEWAGSGTLDNLADQAELGNVGYQGNVDTLEAELLDLRFVIDTAAALWVVTRRNKYQRLGSHRATAVCPTPEWFERLELNGQYGLTHYGGIKNGGWVNEEFKLLALRHDLEQLETTMELIIFEPVTY